MTRGLRNNNPLNIRKMPGTHWQGEVLPSIQGGDGGGSFVRFISIEWGIRAACCILKTYQRKYQATCVEDIITRWAPASENDTAAYINGVCRLTGFGGKERLAESDWPQLLRAMVLIECGTLLPANIVEEGFQLYKQTNKNTKQ